MRNILRCSGAFALSLAMPVHALTWDVDNLAQVQFDDNLFRRPAPARQNDRITSLGSGLLLILPRKEFKANFEGHLTRSWFANSNYLNNLSYSLSTDLTYNRKNISIELEGTRDRKLSDFSEIYENVKNMQTVTILDGRANAIIFGNIRAVASGSLTKSENSSALTNGRGYNIESASAGLGYYSPSSNYLAVLFQRVNSLGIGSYPIDVDGQSLSYRQDFSENRINVILHYQPSVLLLFETQVSYVDRNDKSLFHKNFNGLAGKFSVDWKPRRSIDILTTIGRQLQSDGYVYSDSIREDYVNVTAKSRITKNIGATLGFSYNKRHFVYDVQAPEPIEPRTDHFQRIRAGLTYDMSRRLELGLDGHREWRTSTSDQFRYSDNAVILSLHVKLGSLKPAH
jgi:hypothetical protein